MSVSALTYDLKALILTPAEWVGLHFSFFYTKINMHLGYWSKPKARTALAPISSASCLFPVEINRNGLSFALVIYSWTPVLYVLSSQVMLLLFSTLKQLLEQTGLKFLLPKDITCKQGGWAGSQKDTEDISSLFDFTFRIYFQIIGVSRLLLENSHFLCPTCPFYFLYSGETKCKRHRCMKHSISSRSHCPVANPILLTQT